MVGFAGSFFLNDERLFIISIPSGLVLSALIYIIIFKIDKLNSPQKNRDKVFSAFDPFIQKSTSAGFDAAVAHSIALIRISLSLPGNQSEIFPIIDESLRFYLTRLTHIIDLRNQVGDNTELRSQFIELQNSLENHMRKTQQRTATTSEHTQINSKVSEIQARLDRIETLHRVALQITMDLARLRFACEEAIGHPGSPLEWQRRTAKLLREQLEREKRLIPELQRIGLP